MELNHEEMMQEELEQSALDEIPSDEEQAVPDPIPDPSAEKEPEPDENEETEAEQETESEPEPAGSEAPEPVQRPRRRRQARAANAPVLAIGDRLTVETAAEKARSDLLDLVESMKTQRILTGTIQGVEQAGSRSLAVLYHGDFKIIIPADQAVLLVEDRQGRSPEEILSDTLNKRLGAEIDYIIKGIDQESGIAVGSRLEAMEIKRRQYYFGRDRDGNNLIYEGVCAEARIVSVIRAGIFVDLFGLEVYIPLRELSYQRLMDAGVQYQTGQRVLVKILKIDRSDRSHIQVTASVKQAGENPYEKALKRYSVGNRYVGTVSMVDTTGVFVALDGGIDCLCSYPKRGRPPRGSRVTVRILGINHESNRIWQPGVRGFPSGGRQLWQMGLLPC